MRLNTGTNFFNYEDGYRDYGDGVPVFTACWQVGTGETCQTNNLYLSFIALQYPTPHGLADVVEMYPRTSHGAFERQARSDVNFMNATPPPGTTVTHSGQWLIVHIRGRYFGFMTLSADGAAVTLSWQEGAGSYLVEGPSLGKLYCLEIADELANH